ncbi:MAG: hypothetical protein KF773_06740 [Deltaproteobacteria bacterium]|nr:hypothetical protein [Deltaproteobacteria bacterium]
MEDLLTRWRATRSPALADAIEAQTGAKDLVAWERIGKLAGSRAKTAILRLAKTDDPRLATLYVTWLAQGNWPAPTAKVVWTRIFEQLVALRDARTIAPMKEIAKALPPFVGAAHRAWITSQIDDVVTKLAATRPAKDSADVKALLARVPRVEKAVAAPDPKQAVEAVWADPTDDDLKQVVADALMQAEDPWGDFISIQLRGAKTTPQERTRAKQLEKKHGAEWLGAIGRLTLASSWRFEKGFPVAIGNDRRGVKRREHQAALLAPQWATIHTLRISILHTPHWWITAWVQSPASRNARVFEVGSMKSKRGSLRIEREPGQPWRLVDAVRGYASSLPIWKAFLAGLSPAERKRVTVAPTVAKRDALVAAL